MRRVSDARSFADPRIQGPWLGFLPREPIGPRRIEGAAGMVGGRHAVARAAVAVALEALGLAIEILSARDELGGGLGGIVDRGRWLGLLVLPAAREGLDVRDDGQALLVRELMPRGHRGPA